MLPTLRDNQVLFELILRWIRDSDNMCCVAINWIVKVDEVVVLLDTEYAFRPLS